MTTHRCDWWTRRDDGRQRIRSGRTVAEFEREVVAITEITDGGHPTGERTPGRGRHVLAQDIVVHGGQVGDRVVAGVETQVEMGVDQSRHQRCAGQVDDVCAVRDSLDLGPDSDDTAFVDDHDGIGGQPGGGAVEEGRGTENREPASPGTGLDCHTSYCAPWPPRRHRGNYSNLVLKPMPSVTYSGRVGPSRR